MSTSAPTVYERTAARQREAVLRSRRRQRRREVARLDQLRQCIGDFDCAISSLDHADLDDQPLVGQRLEDAAIYKARLDSLWAHAVDAVTTTRTTDFAA